MTKRQLRRLPNFEDPEDGVYPTVLNGLKELYKRHVKVCVLTNPRKNVLLLLLLVDDDVVL